MEHGMKCTEMVRKPKSDQMCTRTCYDFIRNIIFFGEFLGRPHGVKVFTLNEGMISDFEVKSRSPTFVHGALRVFLSFSELSSEFCIEFVEVYHKFMCTLRSEIAFRMNSDIGVVTFVGKEWRNSDGSCRGIVVGEFTKWK
jgi:hypothetical protein